ncbi:hypothetical protein, partial [Acinetobacter ursingii]|uniref:hypothetical protein n=1 Tax=Acinetobacter ursingii TaxID=108980 RepID=UPI00148F400E
TSPHQHYQHPAMANGYSNSYTNSNEFLRRSQEQSEKQQQQLATQMMAALVAAAAPVSNNYPPLDVGSAGNSQDGQSQDSQSNYTGMYGGASDYYQQQYLPAASYYQPYMGMDSSATGYMMPQPMMDQYSAAYYYGNHSGTKQGNGAKMNK